MHYITCIYMNFVRWYMNPYDRGGQPTACGIQHFLCSLPGPKRKKLIWMNIMCTFARDVGAARGGKKVAHHCPMI